MIVVVDEGGEVGLQLLQLFAKLPSAGHQKGDPW
jgi:hypothetical protein